MEIGLCVELVICWVWITYQPPQRGLAFRRILGFAKFFLGIFNRFIGLVNRFLALKRGSKCLGSGLKTLDGETKKTSAVMVVVTSSNVTQHLIANIDVAKAQHNEKMEKLNTFLRYRDIPQDLGNKINLYLTNSLNRVDKAILIGYLLYINAKYSWLTRMRDKDIRKMLSNDELSEYRKEMNYVKKNLPVILGGKRSRLLKINKEALEMGFNYSKG